MPVAGASYTGSSIDIAGHRVNFLITGGTGFIGTALCIHLLEQRHHIVVLSRRPERITSPLQGISDLDQLDEDTCFDVVINLAGEPIMDKRWSDRQKRRIVDSRLEITRSLIAYFKDMDKRPALFISGSAIGYYGIGVTDDPIDETAPGDDSFASRLCQQWESTALQAQPLGIRTCLLRTGIVLGKGGGVMSKILPLFKMGLGGRIGKGNQWMSWIHLDDLIGIILYCIRQTDLQGPVNGTAPYPVTNRAFTKTLGKILHRPAVLPVPEVVVKLSMGQMGRELVLSGKKILPVKILNAGYDFKFPHLEDALLDVV